MFFVQIVHVVSVRNQKYLREVITFNRSTIEQCARDTSRTHKNTQPFLNKIKSSARNDGNVSSLRQNEIHTLWWSLQYNWYWYSIRKTHNHHKSLIWKNKLHCFGKVLCRYDWFGIMRLYHAAILSYFVPAHALSTHTWHEIIIYTHVQKLSRMVWYWWRCGSAKFDADMLSFKANTCRAVPSSITVCCRHIMHITIGHDVMYHHSSRGADIWCRHNIQ